MIAQIVLCVGLMSFVTVSHGNFPVPGIYPEFCNSTEYYDSISMRCKRCGKEESQTALQTKSHDGLCMCKSQLYMKSKRNSYDITCSPCPTQTVPSKDKNTCLKCGESNPFNETTGHCEPCANGVFVETDEQLICMPCQLSSNASSDAVAPINLCSTLPSATPKLCAQSNMIYSGGYCLTSVQSETSVYNIKYQAGESVQSAFFKEQFNAALHFCKENEDAACQALANMCVLLLYRLSIENNACSEFRKIAKKRLDKYPEKHLWLYYFDEEARWNATKDLYRDNVPNQFTPDITKETSKLHIIAKQYLLNGSFMGITKVKSDHLNLCQELDVNEDIALVVGTRVERTCKRSLQDLWLTSNLIFNDLYLVNKGNRSEWYPIPILIKEILVNGEYVNRDKEQSKWLLVRRYFLTDHVSATEDGQSLQSKHDQPVSKVFRYASDVSLKVIFKSHGASGKIYPPLLTISYAEATPDDFIRNKKVTVKFSISYEMDQSIVMKSIVITMSIFGIFSFGWSILQTFSWFRRSGKNAIDLVTLGKFIVHMCGNLANSFFIVVFAHCFYWLTFFKKQDVLHTVLPTPDQEHFISVYIGIAFTMKAIQLIHLLFVQCSIDIFFIDWERPRVRASSVTVRSATTSKGIAETSAGVESKKAPGNMSKATPDKVNTEMAGISIWRTYYVANEWSEIQSKRKINLGAQLFGVLFILKVLDFESYALASLNFNLLSIDVHQYVPYSLCCRFALGAAAYLGFAFLQIIFQKGIYERFVEDKLQQYVDLCSVSNVSVFLLLTKRFGYYIHGRSTHGKADVNMKEMHEFLRKEEEDLCGHRGLLPDTQQQTFQFILPPGVHDQFLRLLVPLTSYSQAADRMQGVGGRLAKVDIDRVANTHYMLNKFLSGFIDHSFKDLDYVVKDRVMLEYLFDIECFEVADRGYFYNDDGRSFSNVIFYGNESILLLFDVLLFTIIDIAATDFVLSAILTFIIAKALQGLRRSAGRRNLVRKALIDERFLT